MNNLQTDSLFLNSVDECIRGWVLSLGYDGLTAIFNCIPHGKRLRAMLVYSIAGGNDDCIKLASIIELIHMASLLHDDVIDDSITRRGVPSINASIGSKVAIMVGDILYAKAFSKLVYFD